MYLKINMRMYVRTYIGLKFGALSPTHHVTIFSDGAKIVPSYVHTYMPFAFI